MMRSVLVAGIGNIFNRDDGFGVAVAARLARGPVPENVRVVDFGIRGFDLMLALMDGHDLTILIDAVSRDGAPGTLYIIEPDLAEIAKVCDKENYENAHGLHPLAVIAAAQRAGARSGRVVVVGCQPAVLEDGTGEIGLSEEVQAAVKPAISMIRSLMMKEVVK